MSLAFDSQHSKSHDAQAQQRSIGLEVSNYFARLARQTAVGVQADFLQLDPQDYSQVCEQVVSILNSDIEVLPSLFLTEALRLQEYLYAGSGPDSPSKSEYANGIRDALLGRCLMQGEERVSALLLAQIESDTVMFAEHGQINRAINSTARGLHKISEFCVSQKSDQIRELEFQALVRLAELNLKVDDLGGTTKVVKQIGELAEDGVGEFKQRIEQAVQDLSAKIEQAREHWIGSGAGLSTKFDERINRIETLKQRNLFGQALEIIESSLEEVPTARHSELVGLPLIAENWQPLTRLLILKGECLLAQTHLIVEESLGEKRELLAAAQRTFEQAKRVVNRFGQTYGVLTMIEIDERLKRIEDLS